MQIVEGKICPNLSMAVSNATLPKLSEFILKKYDIVLGRRGEMGRCATVDDDSSGLICGTGSLIIRSKVLFPSFLYRVLSSKRVVNDLEVSSIGSTMANLNQKELSKIQIQCPETIEEQTSIATALADADALIESLELSIAKKRQIKQGAMQELLTGKRRLPGFKEEWEIKQLVELGLIKGGGTPSTLRLEFWDGEIPWCTPTDITKLNNSKFITKTERYISHKGLRFSSAEVIPAHSLIMTTRASIGECAINLTPLATNQGFKNIIPFQGVSVDFLYYSMSIRKSMLVSLCSGSTFLEIGKAQLLSFEIPIPPTLEEQTAIATVLSDMDDEITALEKKLAKARQIKTGMMQELLTGRIRLI